jgi:hypothetical protein
MRQKLEPHLDLGAVASRETLTRARIDMRNGRTHTTTVTDSR